MKDYIEKYILPHDTYQNQLSYLKGQLEYDIDYVKEHMKDNTLITNQKQKHKMKLNEFKTQLKETLNNNYIDGSLTLSQYDFLDDLRDSGATNMFGAAPYLMEAFELNKSEAKRVLIDWIKQNK